MTATATAAIITTTTAAAALVKWDTSCSVELPLIIWCEARKECLSDEKETSCRKTNKAMQAMTKGVVSGHENAILYPRFLNRWIHINFGKKKIVIDMGKPMDWDMKLFKRHFKMTNLSVSKAHKLFRKLLPKRLFNTRGIIGIIRFDSSLSVSPKDPRLSSFVSCGCCSLGKLRGSRERKRLKERCQEYRSHSILGLL